MMANGFRRVLLVIKFKYFVGIMKIQDKKNYWLLSNKKTILKTLFNNVKLILVHRLDLELLCLDT